MGHVCKRMRVLFTTGFLYGAAALGPGLGYIVGGQMLNFYVDFDKVDTDTYVKSFLITFFLFVKVTRDLSKCI